MKKRSFWWVAVLLGTLVAAAPPAFAAGPVKDAKEKVKEEKKELHDARKAHDGGAPEEKKELKQAEQELREARKKRRADHMAEMRAKWGDILKKPGVKEEMRIHARRMSRLRRIEKLAKEAKKDAIVKRVNAAEEKEKARHQKKMDELKAQPSPAGSAGGAK